ncbi:hypothetical protein PAPPERLAPAPP_01630 [Brevundimonas phage vB_BpoS-Papperlapapp]|uniref:Uncharacterized protein n=2 Tax=Marchewkavirus TaxID=3425052 RepID=A0A9E7MPC5_9CAUD|nr:hypothetical protein KABACHOK_05880 [Brevundimonas phage vB_BpoS-Kabachok]USN14534.1 hypothetical protein DOMOVOI_00590 [Brevundimonas phage vB_BpoS-Domovoi]USN15905.1 hypothetical protein PAPPERLAPAPP_01630 [Brevundimonas phage vB_BpoS-Papperlapapp]
MWVAIVMGAFVFLLLLVWTVQIIWPGPWERKRRHRERAGRFDGRQAPHDTAIDRFHRNRR